MQGIALHQVPTFWAGSYAIALLAPNPSYDAASVLPLRRSALLLIDAELTASGPGTVRVPQ
jgi:hypothetical protein